MGKVTVNKEICKGCSLCVRACPKKIMVLSDKVMNNSGYFVAEFVDETKCIGCTFCAIMCPDCAITVEK